MNQEKKREITVQISEHLSHQQHQHWMASTEEEAAKPTRPLGVTVIMVLMVLGTLTTLFWVLLLQGASEIDETSKLNILLGLIAMGTIFLSLAVGLWLKINAFRYLFIMLGTLLVVYALIIFLIDGTTAGLAFILPTVVLVVYMLLPPVREYFESTR